MVDETANGLVTLPAVGFTEKSDGDNLLGLLGLAGIIETLAWIRGQSD